MPEFIHHTTSKNYQREATVQCILNSLSFVYKLILRKMYFLVYVNTTHGSVIKIQFLYFPLKCKILNSHDQRAIQYGKPLQ